MSNKDEDFGKLAAAFTADFKDAIAGDFSRLPNTDLHIVREAMESEITRRETEASKGQREFEHRLKGMSNSEFQRFTTGLDFDSQRGSQ